MQKLFVKDASQTLLHIQNEINRSEDSKYDHRLHGVLLVAKGHDCYEVARIFGHSATTIENWVHSYNEHGFEGLHDEKRSGRPSRIPDSISEEITRDLRLNPRDFGYSQNLWDGKLLSHHLQSKYSIEIGVRQAQRLFHKFGFRQRKPRPVIPRRGPHAQEV